MCVSDQELVPDNVLHLKAIARVLVFTAIHLFIGSVSFDVAHWVAHKSHRSPYRCLRWLAKAHAVHHRYFDRNLKFNPTFRLENTLLHLPLELICQMAGNVLSSVILQFCFPAVSKVVRKSLISAFIVELTRSGIVAWNNGHDSNHIAYTKIPKDSHFLFVGPQYHALHHMDPNHYFGSMTRLFDWVAGTAVSLQGRRVALTGATGAFGQAITKQLLQEKVKCIQTLKFGADWSYESYSGLEGVLANTDILILAHGSKEPNDALQANFKSAAAIIELFKLSRRQVKIEMLPEVWYIGSEAELHGAWTIDMRCYTESKRAFVPFARSCYDDKSLIYRHIVSAAFRSRMGSSLVTADWAARLAMWWIRRGARYIPVTYTGIAFANYFRFVYWTRACNAF